MFIASEWKDYEVIDTGEGEKLERWGEFILRRPDPAGHLAAAEPRALDARRRLVSPLGKGRRRVGVF